MPQTVRRNVLIDRGPFETCTKLLLYAVNIEIAAGPSTWKQDIFRFSTFLPIFCKSGESYLRQDNIPILTAFGFTNMDKHSLSGDILIMKVDHFGKPEARRVHQRIHRFVLQIHFCIEQFEYFSPGENCRQKDISLHAWNFVRIPRSTKNIAVEEVDTAVIVIVCLSFYTALLLG
jgi:hypothetical protein